MTLEERISRRAVCFIDILGFTNMVNNMPLPELALKYEALLLSATAHMQPFAGLEGLPSLFPEHTPTQPYCIGRVFSDSFIFVANDSNVTSCLKLLVFAWRLMQAFLAQKIAVRGGITCEQIYINKETGVFLGRGLTEAYKLEKQQDWVGVALDPSVERTYPELFQSPLDVMADLLFPRYMVPLKPCTRSCMRVINWRYNLVAEHGTESLFHGNDEMAVRKKINNTLEYARWFVQKGKVYGVNQSTFPVELRTFWIGNTEPPFPHGDEF